MKFSSEQIQQLLVEKISGTIDKDDDLAVEQLLTENKEVYFQWQAIQQQMQQARAKGFSIKADAEKSWRQIAPHIKQQRAPRVLSFIKIGMVAAMFAVIVSAVYLFYTNKTSVPVVAKTHIIETRNEISLSMDNGETIYFKGAGINTYKIGAEIVQADEHEVSYSTRKTQKQEWGTLAVPAVLDYKIELSDGTEVWMNSDTKFRFPFSFPGKTREVYIDGEAYFKVAKNIHQPFIVHTSQTAIKVVGTQFNVNTYNEDKIETALLEGAVTTTNNNKEISLKPGFEAVYNRQQQGFQVKTVDKSEVLSWMKGVYYFHNTPLKDLSKLLSRWYNVEVQFDRPSIQNKTFTGELMKSQPISLFLDNLRISNNMNSEMKNGVVRFK